MVRKSRILLGKAGVISEPEPPSPVSLNYFVFVTFFSLKLIAVFIYHYFKLLFINLIFRNGFLQFH